MNKIKIRGGFRLMGDVQISGAKNAALPLLCAALLTEDKLAFSNVPLLDDVTTMLHLLAQVGVSVVRQGESVELCCPSIQNPEASSGLVKMMRASILVLGPLLARFGYARISLPGGCPIGARPVDQHIKGLRNMGAEVNLDHGFIEARVLGRLKGAHIINDIVTVTGTENLLMAAVLADGETIIENAACEPEVTDLIHLLCKMGAKIRGSGTNCLIIEGVKCLRGTRHSVMPDRIEAGTFLCAAVATHGNIILHKVIPSHLYAILAVLSRAGAVLSFTEKSIQISSNCRLASIFLRTAVYPNFPTDMQAQFVALASIAMGTSYIVETIFENRFLHVKELNRFGANIKIDKNRLIIHGVERLFGANVTATDLRASASLVVAGLMAQGETNIYGVSHLDRGYANLEKKLRGLGADIERCTVVQSMHKNYHDDIKADINSAIASG